MAAVLVLRPPGKRVRVYQYCNSHQAPDVRSVTVSGLLGYDLNRCRGERPSSYGSASFASVAGVRETLGSDSGGGFGFKSFKALLTNLFGQLVLKPLEGIITYNPGRVRPRLRIKLVAALADQKTCRVDEKPCLCTDYSWT